MYGILSYLHTNLFSKMKQSLTTNIIQVYFGIFSGYWIALFIFKREFNLLKKGDIFLDRIAEGLHERGVRVKRFSKPTFTRLAPIGLKNEIAGSCDAVIEALAD